MLASETAEHNVEVKERKNVDAKIWGTLLQVLEETGRDRVAQHKDYELALRHFDALTLWEITLPATPPS